LVAALVAALVGVEGPVSWPAVFFVMGSSPLRG
jgi:hypothetical protein